MRFFSIFFNHMRERKIDHFVRKIFSSQNMFESLKMRKEI